MHPHKNHHLLLLFLLFPLCRVGLQGWGLRDKNYRWFNYSLFGRAASEGGNFRPLSC